MDNCWDCQAINDENNNWKDSFKSSHQGNIHIQEKENEQMMVIHDTSSDEEFWCSSSSSSAHDTEIISIDAQRLWYNAAQLIKSAYRQTNQEFNETHSIDEINRVKDYLQILTELNGQSLFDKIESIVLDRLDEIRDQVLQRFQSCSRKSNEIQSFLSFFLDEYYSFINNSLNISMIVSYVVKVYLNPLNVTWLMYNKHLYEKFVYMDKKMQHSMSTMIDLFQPISDECDDCSPAQCIQLLNRFLAFDEEMSEIDYFQKCFREKSNETSMKLSSKMFKFNEEMCQSSPIEQIINHSNENHQSSMSKAVDIPTMNNGQTNSLSSEVDSNLSSFESGIDGRDFSSMDEDQIDHPTFSKDFQQIQSKELIENIDSHRKETSKNVSPSNEQENQTNEKQNSTDQTKKQIEEKPRQIDKEKEKDKQKLVVEDALTLLGQNLILPPKPPSTIGSKMHKDFGRFNMNLFPNDDELSKIQSVSFTPGTFGSITNEDISTSTTKKSNTNRRLNLNLRPKSNNLSSTIKREFPSSILNGRTIDQSFRQSETKNDFSSLLSSIESNSSKLSDDFLNQYGILNENDVQSSCRCQSMNKQDPSSDAESFLDCFHCMSNSLGAAALNYVLHPREFEAKERLKLKHSQRTTKDNLQQSQTISTTNKSKVKPLDNNIDDLVRFIDGDQEKIEHNIKSTKSKKNKKKKNKIQTENIDKQEHSCQTTIQSIPTDNSDNQGSFKDEPVIELRPTTSETKEQIQLNRQFNEENETDQHRPTNTTTTITTTTRSSTPSAPSERTNSIQSIFDSAPESLTQSEEEINWITIARKPNKTKSTTTSTGTKNNTKSSNQSTSISKKNCNQTKTNHSTSNKSSSTQIPQLNSQEKSSKSTTPKSETKSNIRNQQQTTNSNQSQIKSVNSTSHQPKQSTSCWSTNPSNISVQHKSIIETKPTTNLNKTQPNGFFSENRTDQNSLSLTRPQNISSMFWNPVPTDFLSNLSITSNSIGQSLTGPVQRPLSSSPSNINDSSISRCVQRPSNDSRSSSFSNCTLPFESNKLPRDPWTNNQQDHVNQSIWSNPMSSSHSTIDPDYDFPLYDPFKSGASLTLPTSSLLQTTFDRNHLDVKTTQSDNSRLPNDDSDRTNFDGLNTWDHINMLNDVLFFRER